MDLALWGHVHNYERTCAIQNRTCQPAGKGTVHLTAGTAGADQTPFPTLNSSSRTWSGRTCLSKTTSAACSKCDDLASCRQANNRPTPYELLCATLRANWRPNFCSLPGAGPLPCANIRCAAPAPWSLFRSEEHGYVRLEAGAAELVAQFWAVDTDSVGAVGQLRDEVRLSARL